MDITGIGAILDFGGRLIDRFFPNPAEAAAAKLKLIEMQQAGEFKELEASLAVAQAQTGVNQVEAGSTNLFVSGWRPFVGWCCGCSLAYNFIVGPFMAFVVTSFGHPISLPILDLSQMSVILLGMLGLGTLRTVEKVKGVA